MKTIHEATRKITKRNNKVPVSKVISWILPCQLGIVSFHARVSVHNDHRILCRKDRWQNSWSTQLLPAAAGARRSARHPMRPRNARRTSCPPADRYGSACIAETGESLPGLVD